ncbi:MAG: Lrp/AsnC family transcriptional regulator [Methermicoccaceae archaeon]
MEEWVLSMLEALERNSKLTPEELSELTGASPDEVRAMLTKLEGDGVIRRYKTAIDWGKVDNGFVYAIIELKVILDRERGYDEIAKRLANFDEVSSVRLVSGDHDLSLTVRGRSMKEVAFFVADKIATLPQITSTATHFVLKSYKEDGVLMVEEPERSRLVLSP